jgi:hypothetical protein
VNAEANSHNHRFWAQQKLAQLRMEQGPKPSFNPENFSRDVQGLWPEQESADDFSAWLDAFRGGKDTSIFLADPACGDV